jgi:hypothetical protein
MKYSTALPPTEHICGSLRIALPFYQASLGQYLDSYTRSGITQSLDLQLAILLRTLGKSFFHSIMRSRTNGEL